MYKYQLPIGDWSDDGHGRTEYFAVSSNKPKSALVRAFEAAVAKYPDLDPTGFVCEYEDREVPNEVIDGAKALGFNFKWKDGSIDAEELAQYTVWFLGLGDPDLELKIEPGNSDLLIFGGQIGYGLF